PPRVIFQFAGKLHLRTVGELRKTLAAIETVPADKGDAERAEREQALRRLRAYRYLAGVRYDNVVLDDNLTAYAVAAARLCAKIGRLDHMPKTPGMPEAEFKFALKGTLSCNLAAGPPTLVHTVDMLMDDSDAGNIARLGHRRWCLNPA